MYRCVVLLLKPFKVIYLQNTLAYIVECKHGKIGGGGWSTITSLYNYIHVYH